MNITQKRIDNLCRWHLKNGGWALQLEIIRHFLFLMTINETTTDETRDKLNENIKKIDTTLCLAPKKPPKYQKNEQGKYVGV